MTGELRGGVEAHHPATMRHNLPSLMTGCALITGCAPLAAFAASLLARRRWSFVAGACLVAAVALWIVSGVNAAFVAATLGVVAWFWDERTRLRPIAIEAERERRRALEESEDEGDEDFGERDRDFRERDEDVGERDGDVLGARRDATKDEETYEADR